MNKIIWLTGLPCSGKTTIARELERIVDAEVLDGDDLRGVIKNNDFSPEGRKRHMYYVGEMASRVSKYSNVIVSLVSPLKDVREELKDRYSNLSEIYVKCPVDICSERDVKGMYALAKAGKIKGFTGVGSDYEEPDNPDMILDTNKLSLEECVNKITSKHFQHKIYSMAIGRYQCLPPHNGHIKLIRKVLDEGKNVCIAIRESEMDEKNPYSYIERKKEFDKIFKKEISDGRIRIHSLPDISEVFYGRGVGWSVREIKLDKETEKISGTEMRLKSGKK